MASIASTTVKPLSYSLRTIERAERALRCSPFLLPLFMAMLGQSIALQTIADTSGVERHYTKRPIAELVAENALLWLIQVGVLRREVDGQGITDSFRLTPLGRQLIEKWQDQSAWTAPSGWDRLRNFLNRWLQWLS